MHFKLSWQSTAILGLLFSFTASAQTTNNVTSLENIVVTPSRTAQLESEVVGDITVIEGKELERAGQSSVAEILSKQPGVQFHSDGGPQATTSIYLRGTNPNQSLVLVDGQRINSSTQGVVNWSAINPSLIDRIEIVRGGASALYGADAIGGVINIITKKGDKKAPLSAWGNIGYGTYDTFKSSVGISGAANSWDYHISGYKEDSTGFNSTNKDNAFSYNSDKDGYESHGFSGGLGYTFSPDHYLNLNIFNGYINGDFDSGADSNAYSIFRQQAYGLTSTNQITEQWQSILRFGFTKEAIESRNESAIPFSSWENLYSSIQRNWSWQNNFKLNQDHSFSALLEHREEQIEHTNKYNQKKRNTNSAGLSYTGHFSNTRVQASVRNDNFSNHKHKTTGSLGFEVDIADNWSIGSVASNSFRMPTFTDLYGPAWPGFGFGPDFHSNPNLKPESAKSLELSANYRTENTTFSATAYRNDIKNLILGSNCYVHDNFGNCLKQKPENINKARIQGLTLTGSHRIGNTTLNASADFLNPKDRATGKQLVRRAKQVYNLGINHQIHNWDLGAEYQFVGKRYDDSANEIRLGGYSLYNLTAAYDFSRNIGVQVRWNNVFNKRYSNAYGYNMPGSNVFINLSFKM